MHRLVCGNIPIGHMPLRFQEFNQKISQRQEFLLRERWIIIGGLKMRNKFFGHIRLDDMVHPIFSQCSKEILVAIRLTPICMGSKTTPIIACMRKVLQTFDGNKFFPFTQGKFRFPWDKRGWISSANLEHNGTGYVAVNRLRYWPDASN